MAEKSADSPVRIIGSRELHQNLPGYPPRARERHRPVRLDRSRPASRRLDRSRAVS